MRPTGDGPARPTVPDLPRLRSRRRLRRTALIAWPADAQDRARRRGPPELHEDRPGHRRAAGAAVDRAASRPYRPALRRSDGSRVLRRAGPAAARPRPRSRQRLAGRADRRGHGALRARRRRGASRPGRGGRRRQLDAGGDAGRGQGRRAGGTRRGRPALVRPDDAGGDQPDRDRSAGVDPADAVARRRREPAPGGRPRRADLLRRQRHDRHAAAPPRPGAVGSPRRRARPRAARLCRADAAPAGQRRFGGAPGDAARSPGADRRVDAGHLPDPPAHRETARGARPARRGVGAAAGRRRSATSISSP